MVNTHKKLDLEKGTIYTTEAIARVIENKKNALVLCEDTPFFPAEDPSTRFLVINKIETFIHRNDGESYRTPNTKRLIYFVQKCG